MQDTQTPFALSKVSPQRTSLLVLTVVELVELSAERTALQSMSQMASDADKSLIATEPFGGGNGRFAPSGCT